MSESDMRSKVTKALRHLDAIAVENSVGPGTPDVQYIEGWIELKWLRELPKRPDTIVTIDHYTPQQKIFAIRRRKKGGRCFMLIQCKREWLLLDGVVAGELINNTTWQELKDGSIHVFTKGMDWAILSDLITKGP